MCVRATDDQAFLRQVVIPPQGRRNRFHDGGRHTAVIDGHQDDRLFVANSHGARPNRFVNALVFAISGAVAGQEDRMFRRDIKLGRTDLGPLLLAEPHLEPETKHEKTEQQGTQTLLPHDDRHSLTCD